MLTELLTTVVVAAGMAPSPPAAPARPIDYRAGTLSIPRLELTAPVYEGAALKQLDRGVGHLVQSRMPGTKRRVALFAHRVTPTLGRPYGPFRYIDRLRRGDRITITVRHWRYRYAVTGHKVIAATAWNDLRLGRHDGRLLLAACHPPGSAAFRYVVTAKPVPWRP